MDCAINNAEQGTVKETSNATTTNAPIAILTITWQLMETAISIMQTRSACAGKDLCLGQTYCAMSNAAMGIAKGMRSAMAANASAAYLDIILGQTANATLKMADAK
jgi:hypothetical protein